MSNPSQQYSFLPTVGSIANTILRKLRVTQQGQPSGTNTYAIQNAMEAMEYVLKEWSTKNPPIWTIYSVTVPITVAGKSLYTVGPGKDIDIGPTGITGGSLVPVDIRNITYRYATNSVDILLTAIARLDYLNYSLKNSPGIPNSFYYQKSSSASLSSSGQLNIYPVPNASSIGDYLLVDVSRYLMDAGTNTALPIDCPIEWNHALVWNAAKYLLAEYEQPAHREQLIMKMAEDTYATAVSGNGDTSSVFFLPDTRYDEGR